MERQAELLQLGDLLSRVEALHPEAFGEVKRALEFATAAHGDQNRASGERYIVHPIETAIILTDLHMDLPTILAAILHDVLEDTGITYEELAQAFDETVAKLVEGVTKLRQVKRKSKLEEVDLDETEAENLRKMFLAMVDDIRVIIIKLADRLHNMRTLQYLPPEKQRRIARETLDIYAPLANRLGIAQLRWQIEDLAFRFLDPETYHEIARLLAEKRVERAAYLERVVAVLQQKLWGEGIPARITGRPKHIYSIYRKMSAKGRSFDQIYDVQGVRIIVNEVRECYHALGIVHTLWRPIPHEFDDYIAIPKDNEYQSLHTAVVALDGKPLEVQIRTEKMHHVAEYGIAAHWRYKEDSPLDEGLERQIRRLRQATDWREEVQDADQFMDSVKSDVLSERVYVFTPKGDILELPLGATPVDFAFEIHSEIGYRCRGAKVDGRLVPLDYPLRNGEQVEILTVKQGGPSRDWLNPDLKYVTTVRARQKIRQWFRRQQREQNIADGREILERELRRLGMDQESSYAEIAALFKFSKVEDFMAAVGYGDISPAQIAHKIDTASVKDEQLKLKAIPESAVSGIQVMGVGDLLTRLAPCCKPVPGDPIVGYITRGKGVTVHRADCPNVVGSQERERLIAVSWGHAQQEYPVVVDIEAFDRSGLLRDIAGAVADLSLSMSSASVSTNADHTAHIVVTVGVKSVSELATLLSRLQGVRNVLDVRRVRTT
ncbi:MAG: bifunctional (p)ppGpp synthetase/guanosine-3',5'-bis(diphosphate) 3'-pyrophosphohydrolase [Chloroflexi bacterium]|nr:bifunctional (p)ppGpp synthetase/guanosine-3',5'-bis(diphosphate) 3'-pyrophosphohydrolase [Chloroflexota bacterium]